MKNVCTLFYTEQYHEKLQSGWLVSGLRYEAKIPECEGTSYTK